MLVALATDEDNAEGSEARATVSTAWVRLGPRIERGKWLY